MRRIQIYGAAGILVIFSAANIWLFRALAPKAGPEIKATLEKGGVRFEHAPGVAETNELHLPAGRTTRLRLSAAGSSHTLSISPLAAVRVKAGEEAETDFTPLWPGFFDLAVNEEGGRWATGRVAAMEAAEFDRWKERAPEALAAVAATQAAAPDGSVLDKLGCRACHNPESSVTAPSLENIWGRKVALEDGRTAVVNEGYVRKSLATPQADLVKGYQPIMPSFAGQVSPADLKAVIEYMKATTAGRKR